MGELRTLLEKAAELCERQRHEDAIRVLEEAARLNPLSALVHYELGYCYAGGCGVHSLYDPEAALGHLHMALRQSEASSSPLLRARILSALGNAYMASSSLPAATRLLSAIDCCRQAAALYHEHHRMDEWAREQFNQGNAWCELPEDRFPEKWERAVALYEQALRIRTRERHPGRHAATLQNLGTAYRELRSGNRARNIRKAIHCYHEALRVRTTTAAPLKNAGLHNNLGNAYLTLAMADNENVLRHGRRALRHFDRALRFYSRNEHPCDYAITQFNRGQAYLLLALNDSQLDLKRATFSLGEAEACFVLCGRHAYSEMARKRLEQVQRYL